MRPVRSRRRERRSVSGPVRARGGVVIDDTALFNDRLQVWEAFYNLNRLHGGLGGLALYGKLRQKTTAPA